MPQQLEERGEKYQRIIAAAVEVIARHGYNGAHTARIAQEAGVAEGTLYRYFSNKRDILISVFREILGGYAAQLERELVGFASSEEKIRHLVAAHLHNLYENPSVARVTQVELRQSDPEVREAIGQTMQAYHTLIDQVVAEGKDEGLFRPELDRRVTRRMIFGTLDECATAWVMSGAKYDLRELAEPILDLILNGIRRQNAGRD